MTLVSEWVCPTCGTRRKTAPMREAFCALCDDLPEMLPWSAPRVDPRMTTPEPTSEQRRIDHEMRHNRGVRGL